MWLKSDEEIQLFVDHGASWNAGEDNGEAHDKIKSTVIVARNTGRGQWSVARNGWIGHYWSVQ